MPGARLVGRPQTWRHGRHRRHTADEDGPPQLALIIMAILGAGC